MKCLRTGMHEEELTHILSFHKQIFISRDVKSEIPQYIFIVHSDSNYMIFLSDADEDELCYVCKEKGRLANRNPKSKPTAATQINNNNPENEETTNTKQVSKRPAANEREEDNMETVDNTQPSEIESPARALANEESAEFIPVIKRCDKNKGD